MSVQPATDPRAFAIQERLSRLFAAAGLPPAASDGRGDLEASLARLDAVEAELVRMRTSEEHARERLTEMVDLLAAIVAFDYSRRASVTDRDDIFDGFAVCLNTLVEELAASTVSKAYVSNIVESMHDALVVLDASGRIKVANRAVASLSGYAKEELVGAPVDVLFGGVDIAELVRTGAPIHREGACRTRAGTAVCVFLSASVMRSRKGEVEGIVCVARDLTELKRAEEQRMHEAMQQQALLIEELSTPLIPVADGILVMPLIGSIDRDRAQRMREALLEGVVARQARLAIIDVTGARAVDQQAVEGIVSAAKGLRLVGAKVIITGIRADVAATLVDLDADLRNIRTRGSLKDAIASALRELGGPSRAGARR